MKIKFEVDLDYLYDELDSFDSYLKNEAKKEATKAVKQEVRNEITRLVKKELGKYKQSIIDKAVKAACDEVLNPK